MRLKKFLKPNLEKVFITLFFVIFSFYFLGVFAIYGLTQTPSKPNSVITFFGYVLISPVVYVFNMIDAFRSYLWGIYGEYYSNYLLDMVQWFMPLVELVYLYLVSCVIYFVFAYLSDKIKKKHSN